MDFESKLDEAMGFGTGAYMALDELRILYHGRRDLYVSFTDDGEYEFETSQTELDRPDSILCYPVNDVIGRKVSSSEFYANVFRLNKNKGEFVKNINHYTKDELSNDIIFIRELSPASKEQTEEIIQTIMADTKIRKPFDKLWNITEFISKTKGSSYGKVWRKLLLGLGYVGFADPSSSGIFNGERSPVVIYVDYGSRSDIDIVPIQKYRVDPRTRVRDKVERKVKRMGVRRNRISKRRVDPSSRGNTNKKGTRTSRTRQALNTISGLL